MLQAGLEPPRLVKLKLVHGQAGGEKLSLYQKGLFFFGILGVIFRPVFAGYLGCLISGGAEVEVRLGE